MNERKRERESESSFIISVLRSAKSQKITLITYPFSESRKIKSNGLIIKKKDNNDAGPKDPKVYKQKSPEE